MKKNQLENQDCGCSDGCCSPMKKNTLWSKIIFLAIILAAGTIILIRIIGGNDSSSVKPSNTQTIQDTTGHPDSIKKAACGEVCDTSKAASCCP